MYTQLQPHTEMIAMRSVYIIDGGAILELFQRLILIILLQMCGYLTKMHSATGFHLSI